MMASSKTRPAGVPEENVYEKMHWMVILTYAAAIAAVALLMHGAG
jgi:microcystin degradation protein MlrC